MSKDQLNLRREIINFLRSKDWVEDTSGDWFEQDLWAAREVSLKFERERLVIFLEYSFKRELVYLKLDFLEKGEVRLQFSTEDRTMEFLHLMALFQDALEEWNFKDKVTELTMQFPNAYVLGHDGVLYELSNDQ